MEQSDYTGEMGEEEELAAVTASQCVPTAGGEQHLNTLAAAGTALGSQLLSLVKRTVTSISLRRVFSLHPISS